MLTICLLPRHFSVSYLLGFQLVLGKTNPIATGPRGLYAEHPVLEMGRS